MFNHESPRRGPTFVTKKIIQGLIRIKKNVQTHLVLGNLYAVRDWGHAKDYAVSMWKILQYKKPDDWVVATNKELSVKKFINLVADQLELKIKWIGKGLNERAINLENNKVIIKIDKKFLRPTEVEFLKGDFSKTKKLLNWKPVYNTEDLIEDMILSELSQNQN